jgi:cyclophilin family peptidyl-prolyl cis-trans isomerase
MRNRLEDERRAIDRGAANPACGPSLFITVRVSMNRFLVALVFFLGAPALAANPLVEMRTSMGSITIELYSEKAPATVANFLQYARDGFYAGTIFHRVIDGFMIQGGGMDRALREKPTRPPIANEAGNGLKNESGTIAMARTADPNSARSQFFINLVDNPALDHPSPDGHGYAAFGKVTKGFEVVRAIARAKTTRIGRYGDVPVEPIVIESVKILSN